MQTVPFCPVAATIDVIGGKWKPMILQQLRDGPCRFNELRRRLPHVTQRMLTLQLRALESDGIIDRTVYGKQAPYIVEYDFTVHGRSLGPILEAMEQWGDRAKSQ